VSARKLGFLVVRHEIRAEARRIREAGEKPYGGASEEALRRVSERLGYKDSDALKKQLKRNK
jgi:hypothetical protein